MAGSPANHANDFSYRNLFASIRVIRGQISNETGLLPSCDPSYKGNVQESAYPKEGESSSSWVARQSLPY